MKKATLFILVTLLSARMFAQDAGYSADPKSDRPSSKESIKPKILRPLRYPILYIGASTGINNNAGLIGVNIDVPFAKNFSVEGNVGASTWGSKFSIAGKYYLEPTQAGWAFGFGLSHNTGLTNFQDNLATVTGATEDVTLDLHPQTNLFLAAYRYWNIGRKYNRFFLELGWSFPLTAGNKFDQTSGDPIDNTSTNIVNLLSPGGLIVGAGFSFGIYR